MSDDKKRVVYRRINGRIVPIKVKVEQEKSISPANIATAGVNASVAGTGIFKGWSLIGRKFTLRAENVQARINNLKPKQHPRYPGASTEIHLTKSGRRVKRVVKPTMFDIADFNKKKLSFTTRQARISWAGSKVTRLKKIGSWAKRGAIPAALIVGASAGISSLFDE